MSSLLSGLLEAFSAGLDAASSLLAGPLVFCGAVGVLGLLFSRAVFRGALADEAGGDLSAAEAESSWAMLLEALGFLGFFAAALLTGVGAVLVFARLVSVFVG